MRREANGRGWRSSAIITGLILMVIVLILYWPVRGYDFIALDDHLYVVENPHIQKGITLGSLAWSLTALYAANWHPLTWLSLMADYRLFHFNAGGYHISNLILHMFNTLLLFYILRLTTGAMGRSVVVAALFAVHPLNIESVAWIAERKNLLGALFWFLTILAYVHYTKQMSRIWYVTMLIFFSLGLMAKPMLVALPVVLLFLDYWPLQRFSFGRAGSRTGNAEVAALLMEKIPLAILAFLSSVITFYAAKLGGAVKSVSLFPIGGRIANVFISYSLYLVKMVWPSDLAIFYPYPESQPIWQVAAAVLFFLLATGFAFAKGEELRYLAVGWFWYVTTLLPVIGVIQVGFQAMANRYAYLALVGVFIIIAWGVPDLLRSLAGRRLLLPAAAGIMILVLASSTRAQLPNWRDSEAAFEQALKVTKSNHIAQFGMGNVWLVRGDFRRAINCYEETLRIKPDYAEAHNNLALALMRMGRKDEAVFHFRGALGDKPHYAEAYNNLGVALADQRKFPEAEISFRRAVELQNGYTAASNNLYLLLLEEGRIDEAIEGFRALVSATPEDTASRENLAKALRRKESAARLDRRQY